MLHDEGATTQPSVTGSMSRCEAHGFKMTTTAYSTLNNCRYIESTPTGIIVVPDGIPAIVPQDLFDRVQEKLAKNKKAPARHKAEDDYLLTTKLFCGYCGPTSAARVAPATQVLSITTTSAYP